MMAIPALTKLHGGRGNRFTRVRGGRLRISDRVSIGILGLLTVIAVLGGLIAPDDPAERVAAPYQAPSADHLFGSDDIGRDVLSRVIAGIQLTWLPGLAIIVVGVIIGGSIGLVSGAFGGWTDRILQRTTDLFLVLPSTLIAVAVVAALGPGLFNTIAAISVFWWPWYSRIMRSEIKTLAARPHVEAARLAGASTPRLLLRYLIPGAVPALLVAATLDVANVVLTLALFSFLGLGAPAPAPELGAMTARNLASLTTSWWLPIFPALVVFLLALTANIAGDGIRRRLESV